MAEEQVNLDQAQQGEVKAAPAVKLPGDVKFVWGTGRRKKATARVRITPGSGKFTVNGRQVDEFFVNERDRATVRVPLSATRMVGAWDIMVNVDGGGYAGQAGAVSLGLSRALLKAAPEIDTILRDNSLLTRDARMKERKKYGQKGARKRFQFSKR